MWPVLPQYTQCPVPSASKVSRWKPLGHRHALADAANTTPSHLSGHPNELMRLTKRPKPLHGRHPRRHHRFRLGALLLQRWEVHIRLLRDK